MQGCRYATNAGPFNMATGACDGGVYLLQGRYTTILQLPCLGNMIALLKALYTPPVSGLFMACMFPGVDT